MGIGSAGALLRRICHFHWALAWRNCSTADTIFFTVEINPFWIHVTSTADVLARAESAPLGVVLSFGRHPLTRGSVVLPIPIALSAVVTRRALPRVAQQSRNPPRRDSGSFALQVNEAGKSLVKALAALCPLGSAGWAEQTTPDR